MTEIDFYEKGYFVTTLPEEIQSKLWRLAYTTEWVEKEHATHLQYPTEYIRVPKWHPEIVTGKAQPHNQNHYYGSKDIDQHPAELVEVANDIINLKIFDVIKNYRNPSLKYLTMWNGSGQLPWHSDIHDSTDMIVLTYLTEEQTWDESWGGTIELRKQLNEEQLYYNKLYPMTGVMIVLNNNNPLMQHQVTAMLNKEINRYTFNFCYLWN
jgi:hypothetical protein